jgi:hypothetical protein
MRWKITQKEKQNEPTIATGVLRKDLPGNLLGQLCQIVRQ